MSVQPMKLTSTTAVIDNIDAGLVKIRYIDKITRYDLFDKTLWIKNNDDLKVGDVVSVSFCGDTVNCFGELVYRPIVGGC